MILDPPGYFGKIPARGDFLSSRLPTGVAASWDAWLERFTLSVREAAGDAWPEAWLTAPLWHFALGAGVIGPEPMAGVLVASVDRVGRMYPFTILGPTGGEPGEPWSAAVETLILEALADAFDPSALDQSLTQLGPPRTATQVEPGRSIWWCRGSPLVEPVRLEITGLPDHDQTIAMVLGTKTPDVPTP